jgi:cytochrome c6
MTVVLVLFTCLASFVVPATLFADAKTGEALFKKHCELCHPAGGNIVTPQKTLHKKDREKNNIKTADDIIRNMRKPGPGMTPFDEKTIPPKDAKEIAEYILKKFK